MNNSNMMNKSLISNVIWLALISLSLFAFFLGWFKLLSATLVTILLLTTWIKGQLIIDYFMGLKLVQFRWRFIPALWLLIIISFIAYAYFNPIS